MRSVEHDETLDVYARNVKPTGVAIHVESSVDLFLFLQTKVERSTHRGPSVQFR